MKRQLTNLCKYLLILCLIATGCGGCADSPDKQKEPASSSSKVETTSYASGEGSKAPEDSSAVSNDSSIAQDFSSTASNDGATAQDNGSNSESTASNAPGNDSPATTAPQGGTGTGTTSLPDVDQRIAQMSLREKVGQLFIVRPESLDNASGVTGLTDAMKTKLKSYPVGGVIMFSQNILSPNQITAFNASLQSVSAIPMFIAVDEEGGSVARLANSPAFDLPKYKSASDVGSSGKSEAALEMGQTIGAYLKRYGFTMDFAPDADVNTNPNNPVIGKRAFSSDPVIAATMARAMADGLHSADILPTFKHFPGHGDTSEDSHVGIAINHKTEAELEACEWLTFQKAGSNDCIMVGHIAVPEITGDFTPSSMSYQVVTEILRNKLHFDGLIVTDALEMGAICNEYGPQQAAVGAFCAGCDILLMPKDLTKAFDAVVAAVEDGTISQARLDESVRRILQYKI